MKETQGTIQQDKGTSRTRRYVLWTIAFLILAMTAAQIFLHRTSVGSSKFALRTFQIWTATVLVVLALLILATVLGRNLIKLYFERKSGQVGSLFKAKMVRIFVGLSLFPAVILFLLSYWMVSGSIEQWFSAPGAELQQFSREIASQYYEEVASRLQSTAALIAERLADQNHLQLPLSEGLDQELAELRRAYRIDEMLIYDPSGKPVRGAGTNTAAANYQEELAGLVADTLQGRSDFRVQRPDPVRELLWAAAPIEGHGGEILGAVVTETAIPNSVHFKAQSVLQAYDAYNQLERQKSAVRFNLLLILALSTLLIVFSFSWFAMYLAKRITVPIRALAEGAAAVAAGNLDYRVQCIAFDELGSLVTSFNRMTDELQQNKTNIEAAQTRLRETNVKLDDRRRYTETILQTITAGVVVLGSDYSIRTMNRAAVQMLETEGQDGDLRLEDVVKGPAGEVLRMLLHKSSMLGPVIRDIELQLPDRTLHLAAAVTPLVDSTQKRTGWIIVLDDLTELLRAEKMAAWQEVARRLAHEIKNPLTPIQLSAERVLNRYRQLRPAGEAATTPVSRESWQAFDGLLDECVHTIIREAGTLKTLVNEFSNFARMPRVRPEEADLHRVIESALSLYNGRILDVTIERAFDCELPSLRLDIEQMKRVFINIFDNALEAMSGNEAKLLKIRTGRGRQQDSVRIEISDTGRGFPKEYQDSLFLPYFSTRRDGTGLGLAIVRQIVSDHHGQVRAEPNIPLGTRIVIDLPLASS